MSYAFFLLTTLMPPHVYEAIMREDDLIFLNPSANLFVAMCVASFIAGVLLFARLRRLSGSKVQRPRRPISRTAIIFPLVAALGFDILSFVLLLHKNPALLLAWLRNGEAVKKTISAGGTFTGANLLTFGVCFWGLWRLLEREKTFRVVEWDLRAFFFAVFLFAVYISAVQVSRDTMLPGFFGVLLVFIIQKHKDKHTPLRKYAVSLGKAMIAIMGLFVLFSWLRGNNDETRLIQNVVGYTAASYNRLAALLDGSLIFSYEGYGVYAFRFLDNMPLHQHFVDIGSLLGMPNVKEVFLSEFAAVGRAGLDEGMIWVSAFGYVYADLGWWLTVLYFFFVGVLSSSLWISMNRGRPAGIILYPLVAFCILFWFGDNFIAFPIFVILAGGALLLSAYEGFLRASLGIRPTKLVVPDPRCACGGLSRAKGAGPAMRP